MSDVNDDDDEPNVDKGGYGKPPEYTRFTKGKSGNSKGRPRKRRDVDPREVFVRAISQKVPATISGQIMKVSVLEVISKQAVAAGLKGDLRQLAKAQKLANEVAEQVEQVRQAQLASEEARKVMMALFIDVMEIYAVLLFVGALVETEEGRPELLPDALEKFLDGKSDEVQSKARAALATAKRHRIPGEITKEARALWVHERDEIERENLGLKPRKRR